MTAPVPSDADRAKAAEGQQDQRCAYGHTKADHDAVGACQRPSLTAREVAAVHYPDPISALRIAFERGWDAHAAALAAEREAAHEWQCPSCGATTRARMADHRAATAPSPATTSEGAE